MNTKVIAVFDIDGTLASEEGKEGFDNLDRYFTDDNLKNLEPIPEVVGVAKVLKRSSVPITFLTGRSEQFRGVTLSWLNNNLFNVPNRSLILRPSTVPFEDIPFFKASTIQQLAEKAEAKTVLFADNKKDNIQSAALLCQLSGINLIPLIP